MTTKLEAINTILSHIGQSPLNSLEGTQSYNTLMASNILENEVKRFQLTGWYFNSEDNYILEPNSDNKIEIPSNMIMVKCPVIYNNRYVVRESRLYDRVKHTFIIDKPLRASVVFSLDYDELPEIAQQYVIMTSANKFVKRALGSQSAYAYTQEDLAEALAAIHQHELEIGTYTMIPEMYNGRIRSSI